MKYRLLTLLLGIAGVAAPVLAAPPYAVIFEVTRSTDGSIEKLQVSKVIDPAGGSTDAVKVDVPAAYIEAARQKIQSTPASLEKSHYFTYFLFDPRDPANLDIAASR